MKGKFEIKCSFPSKSWGVECNKWSSLFSLDGRTLAEMQFSSSGQKRFVDTEVPLLETEI